MNLENFINHVKFFVWFRSMLNLANFKPALPDSNLEYFKVLGKFLTTYKVSKEEVF